MAGWAGSVFIHGGGCAGHMMTRTDAEGRFYIGWQGMHIMWFLHDGITPGSMTAWAPNYRPWVIGLDAPKEADGSRASLPAGLPFLIKDVGDIALTSKHGLDYTQDDGGHFGRCEVDDQFELLRSYNMNRFKWAQLCGPAISIASTTSDQWLNLANAWKRFGVASIKPTPSMLRDLQGTSANNDQTDLLFHGHSHHKTTSELTDEDRQHMCAMLDVRIPELEK